MIVTLSSGFGEKCGYCSALIPSGALVATLAGTSKRCAECAKIDPLDRELYVMQIQQNGGAAQSTCEPRAVTLAKSLGSFAKAFNTLPADVRARHLRALNERDAL